MSANLLIVLLAWLIALAIFFGFIVLLRYLYHRERMALILQGIDPYSRQRQRRNGGILRAGLIIAMVGLTLTAGLYPIGFLFPLFMATPFHLGPWLLPGLIPLGVGVALIGSYYLEQNIQPIDNETKENITAIEDHLNKKRQQ